MSIPHDRPLIRSIDAAIQQGDERSRRNGGAYRSSPLSINRLGDHHPGSAHLRLAGAGIGTTGGDKRPALIPLSGGEHDAAAPRAGAGLAAHLATSIKIVGYVGPQPGRQETTASEELSHTADRSRQAGRQCVVPVFAASDGSAAAVEESATATVAVLPAGADWRTATDFGQPAAGLAEHLACPTLVIHAAPSATPITTPTTAKCEDLAAV